MTFSIVARDPVTGAFGVATATAGPAVGALVPHIRKGIGAVATQAMTNPYLALDALDLLDCQPAEEALDAALAKDTEADRRQVIVVDAESRVAGWTGAQCTGFAGHVLGDGVAVAGNMLTGGDVLRAMLSAYQGALQSAGFARALYEAMVAGAAAGGDYRGIGSAALRVHGDQGYADIDLRVDLSAEPLQALGELIALTTRGPYADFVAAIPRR